MDWSSLNDVWVKLVVTLFSNVICTVAIFLWTKAKLAEIKWSDAIGRVNLLSKALICFLAVMLLLNITTLYWVSRPISLVFKTASDRVEKLDGKPYFIARCVAGSTAIGGGCVLKNTQGGKVQMTQSGLEYGESESNYTCGFSDGVADGDALAYVECADGGKVRYTGAVK